MPTTRTGIDQTLPIKLPGMMLGVGLGGFFDGIFLHQIFQWHHMFSSLYSVDTVPGLRMNTWRWPLSCGLLAFGAGRTGNSLFPGSALPA